MLCPYIFIYSTYSSDFQPSVRHTRHRGGEQKGRSFIMCSLPIIIILLIILIPTYLFIWLLIAHFVLMVVIFVLFLSLSFCCWCFLFHSLFVCMCHISFPLVLSQSRSFQGASIFNFCGYSYVLMLQCIFRQSAAARPLHMPLSRSYSLQLIQRPIQNGGQSNIITL